MIVCSDLVHRRMWHRNRPLLSGQPTLRGGGCLFAIFWVGLVGPLLKISFFLTRKVFKILWWVGLRNPPTPPLVGKQRPESTANPLRCGYRECPCPQAVAERQMGDHPPPPPLRSI